MTIQQTTVTVTAPTTGSTGTATTTSTAGAKLIAAVPALPNAAREKSEHISVRASITAGGVATVQVTPALIPVDVLITVDA